MNIRQRQTTKTTRLKFLVHGAARLILLTASGVFGCADAANDAWTPPVQVATFDGSEEDFEDGGVEAAAIAQRAEGGCVFETRFFVVMPSCGSLVESVTANGTYWSFNTNLNNFPLPGNGADLTTIARFAVGPCAGRAFGACAFQTRTTFVDPQSQLFVESITAYGRHWEYEVEGDEQPLPGSGGDLVAVPHYAQGPCSGRSLGTCVLDTRTFLQSDDGRLLELITAYGRNWVFDATHDFTPMPESGGDLTDIPRYAGGPCLDRAPGTCTLDTRTQWINVDGHVIESITAYGRIWSFDLSDGDLSQPGSGDLLTEIDRFVGPCGG